MSSSPRFWPTRWAGELRDRLQLFRLLCLALALLAMFGIVAMLAFRGAPETGFQTVAAALAIGAAWVIGFRTRRPARLWLAVEAALFVLIASAVQNTRAVFAIMYLGLQYRAMFGSRGQATMTAVVYAVALILVHAVVSSEAGGIRGVLIVELTVGAFCAFIMHTLSEVLSRDAERKSALLESEQRLRLIAENLREALVRTDVNDTITFANSRARDLFGYEVSELIGKKATELLLPEVAAESAERLRRRLAGEAEVYETVLVRKDGTRIHVEVSAGPYREISGVVSGSLAAISDISEHKRLEERLHQGMRLESIGQLAGGVAHDFNNLLTVIKCHTDLLLADLQPGDSVRESIVEIDRSATRGAMLTQQLLAFGRKQFLQPRRVRLGTIVADAMPTLRRLAGSQAALTCNDDASPEVVFADPVRVEHVLATLVRNASEAMPGGGRITIETCVRDVLDDQPMRRIAELPAGCFAVLSVRDTGVGISSEAMGRLFEPFFSTKPFGEGTGLGLASVYGIVRQSDGYVDVESTPEVGTTFRIYLPLATEPANSRSTATEASPA